MSTGEETIPVETNGQALVEAIPAVTYIDPLDEWADSLYVSPQVEDLLGCTQEDWLTDPGFWRKHLHPDDRQIAWSAWERARDAAHAEIQRLRPEDRMTIVAFDAGAAALNEPTSDVARLRAFRQAGVHVLGSFIFGLPSDRPETFKATADLAQRADVAFAQFVMLTPFPGTLDFAAWEKSLGENAPYVGGIPVTRHWLIPQEIRPKVYVEHPVMSADEIRRRIEGALPGAEVSVRDTTGGGDHFEARVVAAAFAGKTRVEQHQMVYAPLRDLLASGALHALALKTEVP